MAKGIGRFMHNIKPVEYDYVLILQTLVVLSIIPLWWWSMNP